MHSNRKTEFCSSTEIASITWLWKTSNTLQMNLVLRNQLNAFMCSYLNWQQVHEHQQSYTDRRPAVEQSTLCALGMNHSQQKQVPCIWFLHLWRVHSAAEPWCCRALIHFPAGLTAFKNQLELCCYVLVDSHHRWFLVWQLQMLFSYVAKCYVWWSESKCLCKLFYFHLLLVAW